MVAGRRIGARLVRAGPGVGWVRPAAGRGRVPRPQPGHDLLLISSATISVSPASIPSSAIRAMSAGSDFGSVTCRARSVSMYPTCSDDTRVPCGASSARSALVSDHSAALAAQ